MTWSDPARIAAGQPEPIEAENPVLVVGIGPGHLDYLTGRARRAITRADVIVGFDTVVGFVAPLTDADLLRCSYEDEAEMLNRFADRVADGANGVAVLMGDPNVSGYQFLGKIEGAVDRPVRVIPGISSIQVAASRARTALEASTFVTLHKRGELDTDLQRLVRDVGDRHLLVLPRPYDWMPEHIAAFLVEAGADTALEVHVFERLTHADEAVRRTTLSELAQVAGGDGPDDTPFSDLSVLVVRRGP